MDFNLFNKELLPETNEEIAVLKNKLSCVEEELHAIMQKEGGIIQDGGKYIFQSGGKRIRPILLILTSTLCNYQGDADILFAQIIEMVHTATLVHDDIIDGSHERRGKPAAHIAYGNNLTVLLGDYFFSKAMDMAIEYGNQKLLHILSQTMLQMIQGEILDLAHNWDVTLSESKLIEIIEKKTAYLFSICTQIPAVLSNAPSPIEETLKHFGFNLGVAFQLIDDLLDYTSHDTILGKPTGIDLKEGKITLPLLYMLHKASEQELLPVLAPMKNADYEHIDHAMLISLLQKYEAFDYAKQKAQSYAETALSSLDPLPENTYKSLLMNLVKFIISRNK
jgi:octaprenyl-diphosphate synthase